MKPRPFGYARPTTLDKASELLRDDPRAVALAGGQSLMPALALRERDASLLVDLTRLERLRGVQARGGVLRIGAGEPMWDVERDPLVAAHAPLLVRALATVGAPGIRSRATIGGSAAWGDPTSQLPAVLLALGATVATTERELAATELFAAPRGTMLRAGELIVAVAIPSASGARTGLRHVRRTHITWPVCGAAVACRPGLARVALYGAASRPVVGEAVSAEAAAAAALAQAEPFDDERAASAYRASVLPVLARRALSEAEAAA